MSTIAVERAFIEGTITPQDRQLTAGAVFTPYMTGIGRYPGPEQA